MVGELDSLRHEHQTLMEGDKAAQLELGALRTAVKERDHSIEQLKEQIKYYVAFAENTMKQQQQVQGNGAQAEKVEALIAELKSTKVSQKKPNHLPPGCGR